jgi:methylmalonyl-CoA mutase N-terminal domain/subunit
VDPLGGSYHVEALTKQIHDLALEQIEKIESLGGAMKAIEQGWQQREIHNAAYQHLNDVESERRKIVGVNHGLMDDDSVTEVLKLDPSVGEEQCRRLENLRKSRDSERVKTCLAAIVKAAESDENLFPHVLFAVKNDCTLGEIVQAMKDVFGTWMAPSGF